MPSIKESLHVEDMYSLKKVHDLQNRLSELNIPHKSTDPKHRLQALLALFNLGILKIDVTPDATLLSQVEHFCKILVREQLEELNKRNLDVEGNKWDHVEVFIRAIASDPTAKLAKLAISDPAPNIAPVPLIDTAVVNLILISIYAETSRSNSTILLPNHPIDGKDERTRTLAVLHYLRNLPVLGNPQQLDAALRVESESARLLAWICSTYGTNYIPATNDLLIPSMPKDVHQFVLKKPCTRLQARFERRMMKFNPRKSIVLWHGTDMRFLRAIIVNGFIPASDERFGKGVFMAEAPRTSYFYAFKRQGLNYDGTYIGYGNSKNQTPVWKEAPFQNYGVLLGCEAAGEGRITIDRDSLSDKVHVLTDLGSVMVRYIFLLPPSAYSGRPVKPHPPRSSVNSDMLKAFKILDERFYKDQTKHSS